MTQDSLVIQFYNPAVSILLPLSEIKTDRIIVNIETTSELKIAIGDQGIA